MIQKSLSQAIFQRSFWNPDRQATLLPRPNLERSSYLEEIQSFENSNLVTCLMGMRRSGKSIIGRQFIGKLWKAGVPATNILYLNFFLRPLIPLQEADLFFSVLDWWTTEIIDPAHPTYLILDEVHLLQNWDENIASIFEDPTYSCRILITGSNSTMLERDLSTKLGGRYTTITIHPFSLEEYCQFTDTPFANEAVPLYLTRGGLPEVIKLEHDEHVFQVKQDILNSIVKNDIVQRHNPSNPELLFNLIDFCRVQYAQQLSISKIQKELSATKAFKQTSLVEPYLGFLREVFFLCCPETYSYRTKDVLQRSVDKIYLGDVGFADLYQSIGQGRLLENMLFNELIRNKFLVRRFLGYRNKNIEIDFWIKKQDFECLIQVCWQLGDREENPQLWTRELGNLQSLQFNGKKILTSLDQKIYTGDSSIQHLSIVDLIKALPTLHT